MVGFMKELFTSKFYATLAALGICAFSHADTTDISGGIDAASAPEIKAVDGKPDIVLNPSENNPSGEAFFVGNSSTINSLKTSGAPSAWNIASGKTTIDINQSGEGNFDAFINNGTMTLGGETVLEFVNSVGSSAVANIDFGDLSIPAPVQDSADSFGLRIKTNANITGKSFTVGDSDASQETSIWISNNSNVNYAVENSSFGRAARIKIDKGSTFTVAQTASMSMKASQMQVVVDGTFVFNGRYLQINEGIISGMLTFSPYTGAANPQFVIGGTLSQLVGNGVINTATGIKLQNGSLEVKDNGKVNITKNEKAIVFDVGKLYLGAENVFSCNGDLADLKIIGGKYQNQNLLSVAADNKFNNLYWQREDNVKLNVIVEEGAHLYFNAITFDGRTGAFAGTTELIISEFVERSIFLKDITGWGELTNVTLTDIDGVKYTKDQLYWHEGKYIDGTEGYWLSTSAVIPEPATCAAIFGAAALALAALRRRK